MKPRSSCTLRSPELFRITLKHSPYQIFFSMWHSSLLRVCSLCQGCRNLRQGAIGRDFWLHPSVSLVGSEVCNRTPLSKVIIACDTCSRNLYTFLIKRSKWIVSLPDVTALDLLQFKSIISFRNACLHSIQSVLFPQILSLILMIKTLKGINLWFVFYKSWNVVSIPKGLT